MSTTEFIWVVPVDHPTLAGHFPGRPIVPGVVLIDQATLFAEQLLGNGPCCWQIGQTKFFSPAQPEEVLTFIFNLKNNGTITFTIRAERREIAAGSLNLPRP